MMIGEEKQEHRIKNIKMKERSRLRIISFLLISFLWLSALSVFAQVFSKREFRGAWIQCVNGQFQGIGTTKMQQTLVSQLDELQRMGANAIIFQVRAECDALYPSKYEPWSKFLTGRQGVAPSPYWDPLQWMVDECHKRGMELHAWINPYRAKTKTTKELAANHVINQMPNRVFAYDGLSILNPGMPENRDYIYKVVEDILMRYDVDGLHIDDYFYPYPVAGERIPDQQEFIRYGAAFGNIADWRRENVNQFIKGLSETIHRVKPWVKFGVSPFGIYLNQRTAPNIGSKTNGLQNYDDLYADVLKWVNNGWVDYCVPQIYWEIGHKTADYKELIQWWDRYAGNRPLYIGEDVLRTVKAVDPNNPRSHQQPAKRRLNEASKNVQGTVLWYAASVVENPGNYATMLRRNYWRYPALQPQMSFIDNEPPRKPKKLKLKEIDGQLYLVWKAPKGTDWNDYAYKYVVYKFEKGETIDLENATKIVGMTRETIFKLVSQETGKQYTYVVTALDRMSNESAGKKKKVKF